MPPRGRGGPAAAGRGRAGGRGPPGNGGGAAAKAKPAAKSGGSVPSYMRGTKATSAAEVVVKHEYKVRRNAAWR